MRNRWMALALLLAMVLAACAEDGGPLARVAEASTKTSEAETARFSVTTELEGAQDDPAAAMAETSGEGEIDFANSRGRVVVALPDMEGAQGQMTDPAMELPESLETIFEDTVVYTQMPTPEGVQWLRIDTEELVGELGQPQGTNDPSAGLEMLRGAEEVEEIGEEEVRGDPTTHYRATVDLEQANEDASEQGRAMIDAMIEQLGTSQMPVEVWIDEEDRVRRFRQEIDISQMEGAPDTQVTGVMVTTVEYYDFGVDVVIETPAEEDVVTMEELQQQGGMGEQPALEDPEGMEGVEQPAEEATDA